MVSYMAFRSGFPAERFQTTIHSDPDEHTMTAHASHLHRAISPAATRAAAVCPFGAWSSTAYAPRPFAKTMAGNGRPRRTEEPIR